MLILFVFIEIKCISQPCFYDNFDDNTLSGNWRNYSKSVAISERNGYLEVVVNRPDSGFEWEQFHIRFNDLGKGIDISKNQGIRFKLKSNIPFLLTLYTVYHEEDSNASVNWLQYNIPGSNTWDDYYFKLTANGLDDLSVLYFYINGGILRPLKGTFTMDNIEIGTDGFNYTIFNHVLEASKRLYVSMTEGTEIGMVIPNSRTLFLNKINSCEQACKSLNHTQDEIDGWTDTLLMARADFEEKVIKPKLQIVPVNTNATLETIYLYANLKNTMGRNIFFGQQDPTGYGVGWSNDDNRSDAKSVCGHYPALAAWDLSSVAEGENSNRNKYRIEQFYALGGFNTLCWHEFDPLGRGFYAKMTNNDSIVKELLPGGKWHEIYLQKLDRIARFISTLSGPDGESIPIIFRPYHEHNGNWFWWGATYCSREEFISLWQLTYDYLTNDKKVNNLIWAYSPDIFVDSIAYFERYPGDDYVDILGHDNYGYVKSAGTLDDFLECLDVIVTAANNRNKVAALTETGLEGVKINNWYTNILLNPIKSDSVARQIAYIALWRNASTSHHYGPYPGHPANDDFMNFYNDSIMLFMDDFKPVLYNSDTIKSTDLKK